MGNTQSDGRTDIVNSPKNVRYNSKNTSTQCVLRVWIMHRIWLLESHSIKWNTYIPSLISLRVFLIELLCLLNKVFSNFLVTQFNMCLILLLVFEDSDMCFLRLSIRECLNVSSYSLTNHSIQILKPWESCKKLYSFWFWVPSGEHCIRSNNG